MKRPVLLKCGKCSAQFSITNVGKPTVSCPSCSCILSVPESSVGDAPREASPPRSGGSTPVIVRVSSHSAKFRCPACLKVFSQETGEQEKFKAPACPRCSSKITTPVTPIAAVRSRGTGDEKQEKMARFVRRNFKVLGEIRAHLAGFEDLLRRADLPEHTERKLIQRAQSLRVDVLATVESSANEKLKSRMRERGVAHGEDLL